MKLEIYLLWNDADGTRQNQVITCSDWIGGIPRLNEILIYSNPNQAFVVQQVRHEFNRQLVSISAELLPQYFDK